MLHQVQPNKTCAKHKKKQGTRQPDLTDATHQRPSENRSETGASHQRPSESRPAQNNGMPATKKITSLGGKCYVFADASTHRLTALSETKHCMGQKNKVIKQEAGRSVKDGTHRTKTTALKHKSIACSTYSHACKILVGLLGISRKTDHLALLARENLCPTQHR